MHMDEIINAVDGVARSGWYLQGKANATFERDYAAFIGTRHCIGCGNGLDALTLIFRAYKEMGAMQEGDEVIVPANTYIASILSITENRLTPVLVEPNPDTLQIDESRIERAITSRTRAILIVHLYGRNAWTPRIETICQERQLKLIEDNAQAHGCFAPKKDANGNLFRTGVIGDAAAHSFYPGKNLGALGDAGAITTNDTELASIVRSMGNYGSSKKYEFRYEGKNSRLDELQAAVLSVKLKYLDTDNLRRKAIAGFYYANMNNAAIELPGRSQWAAAKPVDANALTHGALGDAGAITTNDTELASIVRSMGNYGSSKKYEFRYEGKNSRLDELQAAVLSVKLKYLDTDNLRRKAIAGFYYANMNNAAIELPGRSQWAAAKPVDANALTHGERCVYHIFPVLCAQRDHLRRHLASCGIDTMIHYPIPPHQQACFKAWNHLSLPITERIHASELSIPCNPTMTDEEAAWVCQSINSFQPAT